MAPWFLGGEWRLNIREELAKRFREDRGSVDPEEPSNKINAFPARLEDRKLTLSSRELLNQRGIGRNGSLFGKTPSLPQCSSAAIIRANMESGRVIHVGLERGPCAKAWFTDG
jgi:hypothetical protein